MSPQFTKNLAVFMLKKKVRMIALRMVRDKNALTFVFDADLDICLRKFGTQFFIFNKFVMISVMSFMRMAENVLVSFGEFSPNIIENRPLRHILNMVTTRYLLTISKVKKMNVSTRMMSLRLLRTYTQFFILESFFDTLHRNNPI